jgi:7,8-dihydro-6-hydroxymethylpterin-pyrophosphokinase
MSEKISAFIALGSSIGDAQSHFDLAEKELQKYKIKIAKKSQNVISEPVGGVAKNAFTNAVWEIKIPLNLPKTQKFLQKHKKASFSLCKERQEGILLEVASTLLVILKKIEQKSGRNFQAPQWSDRTLDLDILFIQNLEISTEILTIPHKEIPHRNFVLKPWIEIAGEDFSLPDQTTIGELYKKNQEARIKNALA